MKLYTINLQLFANTVQTTLLEGLSAEMKTFYDKTLITLASPYLVNDQFGQKRDIPKNGGKIIEFRKFSRLPKALTPEELEAELRAIIAEVGATCAKEMGKVMGVASKRLAGRADGKDISTKVKELLA